MGKLHGAVAGGKTEHGRIINVEVEYGQRIECK